MIFFSSPRARKPTRAETRTASSSCGQWPPCQGILSAFEQDGAQDRRDGEQKGKAEGKFEAQAQDQGHGDGHAGAGNAGNDGDALARRR